MNVGTASDQENRPRQNIKQQKRKRGALTGVSTSQAAAQLVTYTEPSEESVPSASESMKADEMVIDNHLLKGQHHQLFEGPSNNATGGSS